MAEARSHLRTCHVCKNTRDSLELHRSTIFFDALNWSTGVEREREREGKGHRELGLEKEVEFNAWYIQFLAIKFANSL